MNSTEGRDDIPAWMSGEYDWMKALYRVVNWNRTATAAAIVTLIVTGWMAVAR